MGVRGKAELEAYADSGAGIRLIPRKVSRNLGLEQVGEISVIRGKGKLTLKLYRATVSFLGIDAMDNFKVCFGERN